MFKKNFTIILLFITIILAFGAVAIIIKIRSPKPTRIMEITKKPPATEECKITLKVLSGPTATPTLTSTPGPSLTPTETPALTQTPPATTTPTPYIANCYSQCDSDTNCTNSLVCRENPHLPGQGIKVCLNESCPYEQTCWCSGPTSTPAPEPTPTSVAYYQTEELTTTPTPITIPSVGIVEDTILGFLAGFSFLAIALLFAF